MSFTSVTIISPEAANGRNVVALGVTKALAAAGKTGVFRPAVCRKDTFTDVLIEASSAPSALVTIRKVRGRISLRPTPKP